jgi:hypothetical protein
VAFGCDDNDISFLVDVLELTKEKELSAVSYFFSASFVSSTPIDSWPSIPTRI